MAENRDMNVNGKASDPADASTHQLLEPHQPTTSNQANPNDVSNGQDDGAADMNF